MRRRSQLVRQQTANLLAIQNQVTRSTSWRLSANRVKRLKAEEIGDLVGDADVALAIGANLAVIRAQQAEIAILERAVLSG